MISHHAAMGRAFAEQLGLPDAVAEVSCQHALA
jgi:hypothetical protein